MGNSLSTAPCCNSRFNMADDGVHAWTSPFGNVFTDIRDATTSLAAAPTPPRKVRGEEDICWLHITDVSTVASLPLVGQVNASDPSASLCDAHPAYACLKPYMNTLSVGDLKGLCPNLFLQSVRPDDFPHALQFVRANRSLFTPVDEIRARPEAGGKARTAVLPSMARRIKILKPPKVVPQGTIDLSRCFRSNEGTDSQQETPVASSNAAKIFSFDEIMDLVWARTGGDLASVRIIKLQSCGLHDGDLTIIQGVIEALPKCEEVDISWNWTIGATIDGREMLACMLQRVTVVAVGAYGLLEPCSSHGTFMQWLGDNDAFEQLARLIWLPGSAARHVADWAHMVKNPEAQGIITRVHTNYYGMEREGTPMRRQVASVDSEPESGMPVLARQAYVSRGKPVSAYPKAKPFSRVCFA